MTAPFLYDHLSYVVLGTPRLDDSISFYRELMGLDLSDYQPGRQAIFRCSDNLADFVLLNHQEAGLLRIGMKVKNKKELIKAEKHLQDRGYHAIPLSEEDKEWGNTGTGFSVHEPVTGLTFDFFHSTQKATTNFSPTVTKIERLGHVVIRAKQLEPIWAILREDFNFVASDYVENKAVWLRCYPNPLHHSLAVVQDETDGLHHVNFMVNEIDDIGKARNRLTNAGVDIVFGPGRHKPSGSVFLYFNDPSGMTMEFSYGMEEISIENAREPRALENSAQTMDQWGGFPDPAFAKGGRIIESVTD